MWRGWPRSYASRILTVNPLPRGFLPKLGKPKTYPIRYPDDDATLLGCKEIRIQWRMF